MNHRQFSQKKDELELSCQDGPFMYIDLPSLAPGTAIPIDGLFPEQQSLLDETKVEYPQTVEKVSHGDT